MSKVIKMNFENISDILDLLGGENAPNILSPILKLFGLDGEAAENILTLFLRLRNGELTLKDLLPALLPVLIGFFTKQTKNAPEVAEAKEAFDTGVRLEPVENFADEGIYSSLNDYFMNDTAS